MTRKLMILALAVFASIVPAAVAQADCGGCGSSHSHDASAKAASVKPDIVDTAVAAGSFQTLAAALKAADLVDALKGEGPFTVFAPTDEAFARLPEGTVEELLKPENREKLVSILTYHVVSGELEAAEVTQLEKAESLNGQELSIVVKDGGVLVAGAKVTQADILCGNGVIHVVENVLLPN